MEANDFLVKIKANGNNKDWNDLSQVYNDYKKILTKLSTKEKGPFSLNVLCLLCRNIEKVPSWTSTIDPKELLTLSIDCIRETRGLNKAEQIKTLACIYHIHRYVVRQNKQAPPELILKLSFMAFENDTKNLLKEYCKTYWNILVDRLTYLEKLKGKSVHKLLPKMTEDIIKTLEIYDTVSLCTNIIVFLFKKLRIIFGESNTEQLSALFGEIFKKLSSKSDLNAFKKLSDSEILDVYVKISDCLYVVAETSSKSNFKGSYLGTGVRSAITLLGHRSDMFHCLQTFYLNSFCDLFENQTSYADAMFKNLTASCEITEKLGYKNTMIATYPFLNQFLKLYIEYSIANNIEANYTVEIQENCLNFMLKVISMLKFSQQLLKCENCSVNSGLHDALRLSFLLKNVITITLQYNIKITQLTDLYNTVINTQYSVIKELKELKCYNYKKYFLRLQTDTHNIAILLNKHKKYQFSINLFETYIKNETEPNNLSRAFYNKSICELDAKNYEMALIDAYLGLVFSKDMTSEKYMSLVMDTKAKSLSNDEREEKNDDLQLMSVTEACNIVIKKGLYSNVEKYLKETEFSNLLKHEFQMYAKLWPSIMPISGVWKSLLELLEEGQNLWMKEENEDTILWTLLEVICTTPSVVRSITNDNFKNIVLKMIGKIDKIPEPIRTDIRVVQTLLLFLKAEYDIADASTKYGWKLSETCTDPEQIQSTRTMKQEHTAMESGVLAVDIWTEVLPDLNTVTKKSCLRYSIQLAEVFIHQMFVFGKLAHGLQLAHICCKVAAFIGEKEIYLRNAGVLAYHIEVPNVIDNVLTTAYQVCSAVAQSYEYIETYITFLCCLSIYNFRCGNVPLALKLVQFAQVRTLQAYEKQPDINLDLAVGRLLEAQSLVCKDTGPSIMSAVNGLQRHYLAVVNNGTNWLTRRLRACISRSHVCRSGVTCAHTWRALALWRRARSAGVHARGAGGKARGLAASLHTCDRMHVQVTIENRLKYIIGLSSERTTSVNEPKIKLFAPKQDLEVMLESQPIQSLSPTRNYVQIPGHQTPDFLKHNNCNCYACDNINCTIISYIIGGLESSMYFRADETEIAHNYFNGVIASFDMFNNKLKYLLNRYKDDGFEKFVVDHVKRYYEEDFKVVKLEILIEATYFELRNKNFDTADDFLVTIHEILQDLKNANGYLNNEVLNLMIASAKLRNFSVRKEVSLETEFENLKLSPKDEIPKTPISKPKIAEEPSKKITVKDDEIPKKRKVIKLNLDEGSSDEKDKEKPKTRRPEFKIPIPVTSKHVLETITPRSVRKPEITVTDTSKTPKTDKLPEFFTPQSTPEQFFTPMNTIKTYSKSNLRRGIVKNLEEEFSTPLGKEVKKEKVQEVPSRSTRKVEKDRNLRRATSPGKLVDTKTRTRRLRQPKLNE